MTLEFSKQFMDLTIQINQMETYTKNLEDEDTPVDHSDVLEEMRKLNTLASTSLDIAKQLYDWYRLPLEAAYLKRIAPLSQKNAANALRIQDRTWEMAESIKTQHGKEESQ